MSPNSYESPSKSAILSSGTVYMYPDSSRNIIVAFDLITLKSERHNKAAD
jgi:hypothetical protein